MTAKYIDRSSRRISADIEESKYIHTRKNVFIINIKIQNKNSQIEIKDGFIGKLYLMQ